MGVLLVSLSSYLEIKTPLSTRLTPLSDTLTGPLRSLRTPQSGRPPLEVGWSHIKEMHQTKLTLLCLYKLICLRVGVGVLPQLVCYLAPGLSLGSHLKPSPPRCFP